MKRYLELFVFLSMEKKKREEKKNKIQTFRYVVLVLFITRYDMV